MIDFTDMTGLFSSVLLGTTLISLVIPYARLHEMSRCLVLALIVFLLLVPFNQISAAGYMRGFVGDLSIPSVVVLSLILMNRVYALTLVERKNFDRFCLLLLPLALAFYPLAMGLGRYDPYSLGYGSPYLLGFVFLVTVLAWVADQMLIVVSLSLAVFCYAIGWCESNNLWDYLIDPLLILYSLGVVVNRFWPWSRPVFRRLTEVGTNL